jgi:hypothetical protein
MSDVQNVENNTLSKIVIVHPQIRFLFIAMDIVNVCLIIIILYKSYYLEIPLFIFDKDKYSELKNSLNFLQNVKSQYVVSQAMPITVINKDKFYNRNELVKAYKNIVSVINDNK